MSAADIPSLKEKKSEVYENAYEKPNPSGDQGFVNISGLFKKSDISKAIDNSRHVLETKYNGDGTAIISITKRSQVPSQMALSVVSQKLAPTNIVHPSRQKVGDISNVNQAVSPVSSNVVGTSATKSQKKTSNRKKNWFSDEMNIQDAKYVEMVDEIVNEPDDYNMRKAPRKPSEAPRKALKRVDDTVWITGEETRPKFRKAPSKDTRDLGLSKKSRVPEEPASFVAISEQKRNKPSKARNNNGNGDWLIDAAFDQLIDAGKTAGGVAKATGKVACRVATKTLHALDNGVAVFGNSSIGNNLMNQAVEEHRHMRSAGKKARASIVATGNNTRKQQMTAGSLVTQHVITNANANNATTSTNPNGIVAKYEKGIAGRTEIHFYYHGRRVTHAQVSRILTHKQINKLKKEAILGQPNLANATSTPNVNANLGNYIGTIVKKPAKTTSGLVKRPNNTSVNKPRIASPSGLVRRHRGA